MIAKKSSRRKDSKSSFGTLAKYILREEKNIEKVEYSSITNCGFDSFDLAVKEIEATQARNTRSKADKTYHLIISFPAGEKPSHDQLRDIEDEMCRAVGLGDHQRISALHTDTDNIHLHVAINKIHPVSHRNVELLRDHYRIDEACSLLEERHGLLRDNRIDRKHVKEKSVREVGRAGDMEAHAGLDSFKRWVKERKESLKKALDHSESWEDLHQAFAHYDIEIRPRGAGLVISASNKNAFTKASDLGREFGKKQLESKFGIYQAPSEKSKQQEPLENYTKRPQHDGAERSRLWETFLREKNETIAFKKNFLQRLKEQRQIEFVLQKKIYALKREETKRDLLLNGRQKRKVYQQLAKNHKAQSTAAFHAYKRELEKLHATYQVKGWQEWLIDRAVKGDTLALTMLRSAVRRPQKGSERFAFFGNDQGQIFTPLNPKIQTNGDVLYVVSGATIRDTGEKLRLDVNQGGDIAAAIRLAREKYGSHLNVEGDEKFKRAVVEAAVASGQAVTFEDSMMEQQRQVLQELINAKAEGEKAQKQEIFRADELQTWIKKRNETSQKTYDIIEYRKFTEYDEGQAIYSGFFPISDGLTVGLYNKSGAVIVIPLTQQQADHFIKHQRVGTPVTLNRHGHVQFHQQDRGHGR